MNFNPKAPAVYKPAINNAPVPAWAPPPVFRPQEVNRPSLGVSAHQPQPALQLKPQLRNKSFTNPGPSNQQTHSPAPYRLNVVTPNSTNGSRLESRPAPPVYRPQPVSQLKLISPANGILSRARIQRLNAQARNRQPAVRVVRHVVPRAGSIQAKFTPDSTFTSDRTLMEAYKILNAAIDEMPGSNVARLRSSPTVNVEFSAGPMSESKAHASIDVPDPNKGDAYAPLANVAQWERLISRTDLRVDVASNTASDRAAFLRARTLAHELAGHVAPYLDILENIAAGRGMTPQEQDTVITGGAFGGRGDHAKMVGGGNVEYDKLVQIMASRLSPQVALAIAKDYLMDISRYEPGTGKTMDLSDEENRQKFFKQFEEAKKGIKWIAELTAPSEAARRQMARRAHPNPLAFAILIAIIAFVLWQMLF